ncbi:MAG: hypothetical protein K0R25_1171 [Rickettsiaceae bacterium]|jgi:glycerophosphoryl diester phosphodiesterase|nr:hypothetical protein [Rickettsiaceae bacterium]
MIKNFAHRGLATKQIKQNSLEAFKNAYKNNFRAIEVDIWYLQNQLILKHDRPKKADDLANLQELFSEFKNKVEYWLDFKNLHQKNCDLAIKEAKKTADNFKIKPDQIYFAPFITDLKKAKIIHQKIRKYFGKKAQIIFVVEKLNPKDRLKLYAKLKEENIYGLSIQYKNIDAGFKKIFHDIKIFAWTVNDQKTADSLAKAGIENIATDNLIPTNETGKRK